MLNLLTAYGVWLNFCTQNALLRSNFEPYEIYTADELNMGTTGGKSISKTKQKENARRKHT